MSDFLDTYPDHVYRDEAVRGKAPAAAVQAELRRATRIPACHSNVCRQGRVACPTPQACRVPEGTGTRRSDVLNVLFIVTGFAGHCARKHGALLFVAALALGAVAGAVFITWR